MENETQLGHNRTGVQMSPIDTAEMEAGYAQFPLPADGERGDLQVRADYADASQGLGTVPPPGTMKGMLKSGVDMLIGNRPQVLVDKIGERLAFERGGTRLYESLLVKCRAAPTALASDDLAALTLFHAQEQEHFALCVEGLQILGADPTAQTPCADLVGVESLGLVQAMNDPRTSLLQSLHVMMDAELLDNAAWEMLVELADACGHGVLAERFRHASTQEAQHLVHLRGLVARMTLEEASLLGTPG
jgi:hypothetical protein